MKIPPARESASNEYEGRLSMTRSIIRSTLFIPNLLPPLKIIQRQQPQAII